MLYRKQGLVPMRKPALTKSRQTLRRFFEHISCVWNCSTNQIYTFTLLSMTADWPSASIQTVVHVIMGCWSVLPSLWAPKYIIFMPPTRMNWLSQFPMTIVLCHGEIWERVAWSIATMQYSGLRSAAAFSEDRDVVPRIN